MGTVLIPVSGGKAFALIDEEDFERVSLHRWHVFGAYAAMKTPGGKGRTRLLMHRFIMNAPDDKHVDHINGDGLDNRRSVNLRFATHTENMANCKVRSTSRSGFKGVGYKPEARTRPWRVVIRHNGQRIRVGYFATAIEAAKAYDAKAREIFGEFARLNFPD